jgi:signal transduction histidine kinase
MAAGRPERRRRGTEDVGNRREGSGAHRSAAGRPAGFRSIRRRIVLPVGVATVGLIALGTVQAVTAARAAGAARQAVTITAMATATVRLAHDLELEVAESDALRQRGGSAGAALLTATQQQTDLAVSEFRAAAGPARRAAPVLQRLVDAADHQASLLAGVRSAVGKLTADDLAGDSYETLNRSLLAIADAVPEVMTDVGLAATARSAAAIAAAEHLAAQRRDLLRGVFRRGAYQPGELATLASLTGAENERTAEFNRYATVAQRDQYAQLVRGDDVTTATTLTNAALAADRRSDALRVDPDVWYIAQSNTLRRLHLLEVDLSRSLDQTARSEQALAQLRATVTGVSTAGLVALALGTALLLAIRLSRRLRQLRSAALAVAGVELPGAITSLTDAANPATLEDVLQSAEDRADALLGGGSRRVRDAPDEIGAVSSALGAVHKQALRLAADQAALRLDVAALFVALSRRGQTLIQRQLRLIDQFERSETDPRVLHRLFQLDHLAARMRRNEENLLVLAGGEPGRRVLRAVVLVDMIRAAAAEIEDYDRVDPSDVAEVGVAAHAARDMIHLLAELLENATAFSPPTSRVRVTARRSIDAVTISVFDDGIGMPADQVRQLNQRLRHPTVLTAELAGTMGLLVVGRLAARHHIGVELRSSPGGGTVALVEMPNAILAPVPALTVRTESVLHPTSVPHPASVPHPEPATIEALPERPAVEPVPAPPTNPLPRRRPGGLLLPGAVPSPVARGGPAGGVHGGLGGGLGGGADGGVDGGVDGAPALDPEVVRARLAGLGQGLARGDRRPPASVSLTGAGARTTPDHATPAGPVDGAAPADAQPAADPGTAVPVPTQRGTPGSTRRGTPESAQRGTPGSTRRGAPDELPTRPRRARQSGPREGTPNRGSQASDQPREDGAR